MSNHYLEILGLQPGADEQAIKRAYRTLSKKYHPDISKDPKAHDKFIEINEAYNFLTKVGPSPNHESVAYDYDPEVDYYKHWREEARRKAWQKTQEEAKLQQAHIKRILKGFDTVSVLIVAFNLFMILDYFLPRKTDVEQVVSLEQVMEIRHGRSRYEYDLVTTTSHKFRLDKGSLAYFMETDRVRLHYSTIFNKVTKLQVETPSKSRIIYPEESPFALLGFFAPLLLLGVFLYKFILKTLDQKLTLSIAVIIFWIIQLVIFNK